MARLDNRPLLGTSVDADLFVPPASMPQLRGAVERSLNTMLLGAPGAGKTTTLRMLEATSTGGRPMAYVDLAPATDAGQALMLVSAALGDHDALSAWGDGLRAAVKPRITGSDQLLTLVRRLGRYPATTILADSPPAAGQSHLLFGRLRDELWQLPHSWVVAADTGLRSELSRPPADAFFDVRLELGPLAHDAQRDLLRRRLEDDPDLDVDALVGQSDGLPRSIVSLARDAALTDGSVTDLLARRREFSQRLDALPPTSRTVARYLAINGPTSASDPVLLDSLNVSPQRARKVLTGLEQADLARSFPDHRDKSGRPRKLYELIEAGRL